MVASYYSIQPLRIAAYPPTTHQNCSMEVLKDVITNDGIVNTTDVMIHLFILLDQSMIVLIENM